MSRSTLLWPEQPYRWNYLVMGLDMGIFVAALSFASIYGVLPLFVHHLNPSNVALGLIPAVRSAGFLIPPVFMAVYVERLRLKKPFVISMTVVERVPYLVLAIVTPLLALTHPGLLLWLFFILLAIGTTAGGTAMSAWMDLLARMLPPDWRGRFFGLSAAFGGLLSIAGGVGAAELLHRFDWPTNFALCFAATSILLAISFVFICFGREPAPVAASAPSPGTRGGYWRRLPTIIRDDRNFGRYLMAMALLNTAGMATAFYTVDAQRTFHLSDAGAGVYAIVLLASSTAGNVLWGYVGDHLGHKRVVEGGAICTGLAALLAVVLHDPRWGTIAFGGVFLLIGLGSSGFQLASLTFVIDVAPPEQRPTYIGLATVAQAPFGVLAAPLGGLIADRLGYQAVFVLTVVLALSSAAIVVFRVFDPRVTSRSS
jgi:MFS family permease